MEGEPREGEYPDGMKERKFTGVEAGTYRHPLHQAEVPAKVGPMSVL